MTDYAKWDRVVAELSDSDDDGAAAAAAQAAKPKPAPKQKAAGSSRAADAAATVERMQRAERLGEEVLTDRQQMVELDRQRNKNREALAALRRLDRQGGEAAAGQKHWVWQGGNFLRHSQADTRSLLEADQARLDTEIERLRGEVKRKTSTLCELDPSMCAGPLARHWPPCRPHRPTSTVRDMTPSPGGFGWCCAQSWRLRRPPLLCGPER